MASRLYRTTRRLYEAVAAVLRARGVPIFGTPTWAILLRCVVTGLILLEARPTPTRVARLLPGRGHGALNRWYRLMGFTAHDAMVTNQTRLTFDVIQPLWRSRGPSVRFTRSTGTSPVLPIDRS